MIDITFVDNVVRKNTELVQDLQRAGLRELRLREQVRELTDTLGRVQKEKVLNLAELQELYASLPEKGGMP